jgi:hypothetical protein
MQKIRQVREKRARNAEYAERFPRRDRATRKKLRRKRVVARERRWLQAHGIERIKGVPLA